MANEQNLIPQAHKLTVEEQSKGGKASGKARRRRKLMREALDELLSREYTDRSGNQIQGVEAISMKAFQAAMDGDLKAIEFIRNTCGEAPIQRVEVDTIDPQARERVERILSED